MRGTVGGHQWNRIPDPVDEPAQHLSGLCWIGRGIARDPDLRGSIYLDTATSQIVQTTMVLERPSPIAPATDTWTLTLTTRFHDVLPTLPVIRSLCSRTTGTSLPWRLA